MPKVSVIIPVYGVEQYIENCIRSLFEQTLDDIEYIFVDDCTPDRSINILQELLLEYSHRVSQVKIIKHKHNMKQHIARQTGIQAATGEYVIHCDPDDTVELNMYEVLYKLAVNGNYDYVWCDYVRITKDCKKVVSQKCNLSKNKIFNALITGKIMGSLCNRLVKRSIVQDPTIIQPLNPFTEDLVLVIQYSLKSKRIQYVDAPLYHYWLRENSITTTLMKATEKVLEEKLRMAAENLRIIEHVLTTGGYYKCVSDSIVKLKFYYKQMLITSVLRRKDCTIWQNTFPEVNFKLFFCRQIPFKSKIQSLLLLCNIYHKIIPYIKK